MAKERLNELYNSKFCLELKEQLQLKNIMQVPKLVKIVVNIGVKEAVGDSRVLQKIATTVSAFTGQKPVITKAKKSIAGFKIREGMPLGVMVTLRKKRMYEFLDKLINIALPNVRDFRGVSTKFDGRGNYNLGIKDWSIFPEADTNVVEKSYGFNISIHSKTMSDAHSFALLKKFNMPFRENSKK